MNRLCLMAVSLVTLALSLMRPAHATDTVPLSFNLSGIPQFRSDADIVAPSDVVPSQGAHIRRQRQLFSGGANSLAARTIGHAEGTRTLQGGRTPAYYGHVDPGNGIWNLGSFSFQHCPEAAYQCTTPEVADIYQLRRLQGQALALQLAAEQRGLRLTLVEHLNGLDLANQAPMAALGIPGYVALLQQAHRQGLTAADALLWARVQSYWNPQTQRWDAPGLGNTSSSIRDDQNRRMVAIAQALAHYSPALLTPEAGSDLSRSTYTEGIR